MNPLPYLDIHTHLRENPGGAVSVCCLSKSELESEIPLKEFTTVGIHPWWIEDLDKSEITKLKQSITKLVSGQQIWGIGETGIDRSYPEFLNDQIELFLWHVDLAEQNELPLIIHSVRAGADFLQILKVKKPKVPWIFHDFRGNETLMKELLRLHGECYFSFGLSIDNSPQIRELLPSVPPDRLFLETDDQKHLDIRDIYVRAGHFLQMDEDFLKAQIWHNFKKICKNRWLALS